MPGHWGNRAQDGGWGAEALGGLWGPQPFQTGSIRGGGMRHFNELSLQNCLTILNISVYIIQLKFNTTVWLEEPRIAEYQKFPQGFLAFLLLSFYLRQSVLHIKYVASEWSAGEVKSGSRGGTVTQMKKWQARTTALETVWTHTGLCMWSLWCGFPLFYDSQDPEIHSVISRWPARTFWVIVPGFPDGQS